MVLTPGTPDNRKLREGDEIHVMSDQATPGDIMEEVKDIADSVKQVATQLANSIGTEQGGQNMRLILQNLADSTEALNKTDSREPRSHPRHPAEPRRDLAERQPTDGADSRERARRSPRTCASSWPRRAVRARRAER